MFVAPLVFLLGLLLIPLWPAAIILLSAVWLASWPVERLLVALRVGRAQGVTRRVAGWLRVTARPWLLFEAPPRNDARAPESTSVGDA